MEGTEAAKLKEELQRKDKQLEDLKKQVREMENKPKETTRNPERAEKPTKGPVGEIQTQPLQIPQQTTLLYPRSIWL